ncbi:MAG: iron export ABC transporter permease subunit FetB [Magnetococcales bacterium]|nr:iron export ABC transporter permease subunit FetB [Magnetococcales bacterium]
MTIIALGPLDLGIAALLIVALAATVRWQRLGLEGSLLIAAARTVIQLLLIGMVLKSLFAETRLLWIALLALAMLLIAGREVAQRQKRRFLGWWGFGIGTGAMFTSSFTVTLLALVVIIGPTPWYAPQYAIPLLGMMLGNTMTGIALALERLTQEAWRERGTIEARLALGHSAQEAMIPMRRDAIRTGLTPIINSMAAAGIVSLPGMMTGQILGGNPPMTAVGYQILIMFMISAGTGFGTLIAVWIATRRLFDRRQRLRLDRLNTPQ